MAIERKTLMLIVFINVAVIFHYLPIILNSDGPDSETGPLQDPPVEDSLVKVTFVSTNRELSIIEFPAVPVI